MADASEEIQLAHRSGTAFGISLAEVILIILFIILLLLIFSDNELLEEQEKRQNAEQTIHAIEQRYNASSLEELPSDWSQIVLDYEAAIEHLSGEKNALSERLSEAQTLNSQLSDDKQVLEKLVYEAKGGDTTICTYVPSDNAVGKRSVSLASVWIQNDRIIYLKRGIGDASKVIDFYLKPYDPSSAIQIIDRYVTGQVITNEEFGDTNRLLNDIGNQYETETRASCRFSFDYYYENSLSPERFDGFSKRYYLGARMSLEEVMGILRGSNLEYDVLRENASQSLPAKDVIDSEPTAQDIGNRLFAGDGTQVPTDSIVEAPRLIRREVPEMPRTVRRYGDVIIAFYVDEEGNTVDADVQSSPSKALSRSALRALRRFKYEPKTIDGVPVRSDLMTVTFRFER